MIKIFAALCCACLLLLTDRSVAQPALPRAQSLYVYDHAAAAFIIYDSVWYYYSGGRGGTITMDHTIAFTDFYNQADGKMAYDSLFRLDYRYGPALSKKINTYDSAEHALTVAVAYKDTLGTVWKNELLTTNIYTAGLLSFSRSQTWDTGWSGGGFRTTYLYNAHDNLIGDINNKAGAWPALY